MHEALLHAGLVNHSPRGVRLSVDVRFQNPSAPRAVVGRIDALSADSVRIRCEDGQAVALAIDDSTLLRGAGGRTIPHSELPTPDLAPGTRVIAARRGASVAVIRPL